MVEGLELWEGRYAGVKEDARWRVEECLRVMGEELGALEGEESEEEGEGERECERERQGDDEDGAGSVGK